MWKLRWLFVFAGLLAIGVPLLYPVYIFESYGKYVPCAWSRATVEAQSVADIERRLGPPAHDLSAKEVKIWTITYGWGEKSLTVISDYSSATPKARFDGLYCHAHPQGVG